jgi:hypothetical protein
MLQPSPTGLRQLIANIIEIEGEEVQVSSDDQKHAFQMCGALDPIDPGNWVVLGD